jgi:cation diffusion facilitator CzcD-associated flavoprotein CzcO
LTPYDLYAKRPLCCDGYYSAYNRPNVHLVDAKATPIKRFVETGVETSDGRVWELDVVIMATGFDAVTGNYLRIETVGRDGRRLEEHWRERPRLFLGLAIAGFPNLFTVFGPLGAFTNRGFFLCADRVVIQADSSWLQNHPSTKPKSTTLPVSSCISAQTTCAPSSPAPKPNKDGSISAIR